MNRKGFTLVELSIVLVIIGLLIGGILVAQSLIDSSKVQSFVRQIGQFDAAVASFKDRYKQLPGDNNIMGANPGDNDGRIEDSPGDSWLVNDWEIGKFWSDLGISGLKAEDGVSFVDRSSSSGSGDGEIPKSKLGNNATFAAHGGASGRNYYTASAFTFSSAQFLLNDGFLAADVLAVDSKMDDGLANTGHIVPADSTTIASLESSSGAITLGTDCTTTAGGPDYDVAEAAETCSIRIRMGSTLGVLY